MPLKNVELVRRRLTAGLHNDLVKFRVWLSLMDGNVEAVDRLRDGSMAEIVAVVVENVMSHIGHDTVVSATAEVKDRRSQARKAARRVV